MLYFAHILYLPNKQKHYQSVRGPLCTYEIILWHGFEQVDDLVAKLLIKTILSKSSVDAFTSKLTNVSICQEDFPFFLG